MGILADVVNMQRFEREKELADINAIGQSVQNFVQMRELAKEQSRQSVMDELKAANILSQIQSRQDPFTRGVKRAQAFTALQEASKGGDVQSRNLLRELRGDETVVDEKDQFKALSGESSQFKALSGRDSVSTQKKEDVGEITSQEEPVELDFGEIQLQELSEEIDPDTGNLTPEASVAKERLDLLREERKKLKANEAAVSLQELKKGAEIRRNLDSGDAKLDITLDEWINFLGEQIDIFGPVLGKPGPVSGFLTNTLGKISPSMRNEFFKSFQGSTIELAAFVGRNAMPGTRAARIIDLFRQTAPDEFDTLFGGINNAAVSWAETIATDFSTHQDEYIPGYSDMSREEKSKARTEVLKPYIEEQKQLFRETYIKQAYKKDIRLFNDKEAREAEDIIRRDVRRRAK